MLEGYLCTQKPPNLSAAFFLTPASPGQRRQQVRADVSFQIRFHSSLQTPRALEQKMLWCQHKATTGMT